ncbi:cold-shock protein [Kiloniella laminariae]|uniref:cold-shock protein n=1 Tax=Kiloniella laminariae TaxID=454162 RepID=UPI0003667AD2|nr:cold-shock protein [Kiloniella laminariae]
MQKGVVRWFNSQKGYGFITPDAGGEDAFVHFSAIQKSGLPGLVEGQQVEYELVESRKGRYSADNLKLAGR